MVYDYCTHLLSNSYVIIFIVCILLAYSATMSLFLLNPLTLSFNFSLFFIQAGTLHSPLHECKHYPSEQTILAAVEHYLGFPELVKVRGDVEENAVFSPWERDASEKQDEEHEVRISGREVDHLRRMILYNLVVQPAMLSKGSIKMSLAQNPCLPSKLMELCSIGYVHQGIGPLESAQMPVASKSNYLLATRII